MFSKLTNQLFETLNIKSQNNTPASTLGYTTNNKYNEFPPLMNDGRSLVSSWVPESQINKTLKDENSLKSNWEYRQHLINNGETIMKQNYREAANDTGYNNASMPMPNIQSNEIKGFETYPYSFKSVLDDNRPKGYSTSDLKQAYLTREQLASRQMSPVITQEEMLRR
jgi:hypothetical protein